jgi:hypothetical protein
MEETLGYIKIMTSSSEKVGLPNYSSVDIGPISVTRFIEEGDDEYIKKELKKNLLLVEELIAEVREEVLTSVQEAKKVKSGGYE